MDVSYDKTHHRATDLIQYLLNSLGIRNSADIRHLAQWYKPESFRYSLNGLIIGIELNVSRILAKLSPVECDL